MAFLPPIDTSINLPAGLPFGLGGGSLDLLGTPNATQSVDGMVASIASSSLSYPFKYEVFIRRPNHGQSVAASLRWAISCESFQIPGKTIATQEIKTTGPITEMPYELSFAGDIEGTWKVGGDFFERKYFEQWNNEIVSPTNHMVNYMDNYTCEIEITQLNQENSPIHRIVLEDAYPKTINPIQIGDELGNTINKQTIGFAYRKWRAEDVSGIGFLQGIVNRVNLRGRLNRKLDELFGDTMPMIPTAVGGQIINLPFGFDPGQITNTTGNFISQQFNNFLG